jgi:hypothetical protein
MGRRWWLRRDMCEYWYHDVGRANAPAEGRRSIWRCHGVAFYNAVLGGMSCDAKRFAYAINLLLSLERFRIDQIGFRVLVVHRT